MRILSLVVLLMLGAARLWHRLLLDHFIPAAYLPDVLRAITIATPVVAFLFLDRLIRHHYWRGYLKQRRNREAPAVIQDIVTIVLLLLGAATGLWWLGSLTLPVFLTAIVAISGAIAFLAGNALQPIILDLVGGVTINFDGSFKLGDWLTIYGQDPPGILYGCVVGITWRTTFLRQEDGTQLAVPNRLATLNPVVNHSRQPHTRQYSVEITLDVRLPPGRVVDMLLGECFKAVRRPGFAHNPAPIVVLSALSADSAVYQVRFHAYPDRIAPSEAISAILQTLLEFVQQNRLPLPSSQVELGKPPDVEFELGEAEIALALARVRLFRDALSGDQAQNLAGRCRPAELPRGEILMRQGAAASSVFVILEGAASVWITGPSGERQDVAVLASGDIVGEMSLLTGAPRNATVTALTRLRVLEITKHAMAQLVEKSPEILERFSHVLSSRQRELDELAQQGKSKSAVEGDLLERMISFFSHAFGRDGADNST